MKHEDDDDNNSDRLKDELMENQVTEDEDDTDLPDVDTPLSDLESDYDSPTPDALFKHCTSPPSALR
jgi:hypothetical protein